MSLYALWYYLHNYFDYHVCLSIRPVLVRHKFFSPLNRLGITPTPGVDPSGWPQVAPGHAAPPEEIEYAHEAGIF